MSRIIQERVEEVPKAIHRALLIVIHEDDIVAVCVVATAHDCIMAAAVLCEIDGDNLRIFLRSFDYRPQSPIGRAVVYGNHLVVKAAPLGHDLANLIDNELNRALALIAGYHEANFL